MSDELSKHFEKAKAGDLQEEQDKLLEEEEHKRSQIIMDGLLVLAKRLEPVKKQLGEMGYQAQVHKKISETSEKLLGLDKVIVSSAKGHPGVLVVQPSPANLGESEKAYDEYMRLGGFGGNQNHKLRREVIWPFICTGVLDSNDENSLPWITFSPETNEYWCDCEIGGDRNKTRSDLLRTQDVDEAAKWLIEKAVKLSPMPHPYISVSSTDPTDTLNSVPRKLPPPHSSGRGLSYRQWAMFAAAVVFAILAAKIIF